MDPYSPEQRQAIKCTVGSTAPQASVLLNEPIERIERFIAKVGSFVKSSHHIVGERPYMLILVESSPQEEELSGNEALRSLRRNKPVFRVDEELRLVSAEEGSIRLVDCGIRTADEKALGVMVRGSYKYDILMGTITDEGNVSYPGADPLSSSKFHHPMIEFEILVHEHKEKCLDREQNVKYWQKPRDRILRGKPDSTESVFHLSLFSWLNMFVIDKLRIFGETLGLGQDKTDIEVVTIDGTHLVEIKWLGENENGTKYDESTISRGLAQVKIYLDHDQDWQFICAHLVVYDGRPLQAHQTKSGYDDSQRHNLCRPPHILFLESETPSVMARRIAR